MTTTEQKGARARKHLFIASTGGHLAQLVRLSAAMDASDDSLWITFRSQQSESLLAGRRVEYVPYVRPRDVRGVARTMRLARAVLRRERFDLAVSTGAAIALGVFPVARLHRVPRLYIESVSRVDGPSLTGRILDRARLAEVRTQHPHWASGRWGTHPSVLSQFRAEQREVASGDRPLRIFVTLGTIRPFRFDSLVDGMIRTGLVGESTTWQLGETDRTDLPGRVTDQLEADDFDREAREADVVVTHAGVGTILALLEMGIHPVIVPRRRERGEHVDDHQLQISRLVRELGVGTVCESTELTADALRRAASLSTVAGALET